MLVVGLILVGVALLLGAVALVVRNKGQRVLATPILRTGAGPASGPASFEGAVRTNQALVAPVSGKPCVYFDVKIEGKIKETRNNTTTTKWKLLGQARTGSNFTIDDGSGPLLIAAQDPSSIDADLQASFNGPPPGGALGALAAMVPAGAQREPVLEYRVTEKIIDGGSRLFALGHVNAGQLGAAPNKKLLVSTRGRDALLGSTKRLWMGLSALAGLFAAAGALLAIVRPGEARACGALVDGQHACVVKTAVEEFDETQPDGSTKKVKEHRRVLDWKVTKAGAYRLRLSPVKKQKQMLHPVAQVENSFGIPMNIGMNLGLSTESVNNFKTKTAQLTPGEYRIYATSIEDGPDELLLAIEPLADSQASK